MARPTVSVLLPARNAEATVEAAARSILEGTFSDFELLAIDDGSTDATGEILRALAKTDARMRVLQSGGKGVVTASELGRAEARATRFIARMDADDLSLPMRLETEVRALEADPSLWAVGSQVEIFSRGGEVSPNLKLYEQWLNTLTTAEALFRDRLVESPICQPSALMRREALEQVGGWKDDPVPEDWALWLAMLEAGGKLRAVESVLLRWADHPARLTRTDPRYSWDALQLLKAQHLARTIDRSAPLTVWGAGEMGLTLFRNLRALGLTAQRFIEVHPRKVGQRIEGLPVLAPEGVGEPGRGHLVAAVGAKGARAEIRAFLSARGWREGEHFTCAG